MNAGDLPIVVGVTLLGSFFFVVTNVIVDILYAVLDARVRGCLAGAVSAAYQVVASCSRPDPQRAARSLQRLTRGGPPQHPRAGGPSRAARRRWHAPYRRRLALAWTDADGVPTTAGAALARLTGRQLVSLDGVDSLGDRADPIPDLTPFADPSDDKLTVTARLRSVKYAPPYGGTLRAADVVFGLELLCDPEHPDADSDLLADALVGYAEFCSGMRACPTVRRA